MITESPEDVTRAALAVMKQTTDPRLREIMTSLVGHLHGFVRDTRLTEAEFRQAAAILNEMGKLTSDTHNEMVLMAGSLGVSSLVCLQNNGAGGARPTSQNLLGPFWRMHSPITANGGSIVRSETPGEPLAAAFTFVDERGAAIEGLEVDIWHASPAGLYENQDPSQENMNLRGKFKTDASGRIWFRSVRPAGYPIPTDGVVGRLLRAQNRHPFRPAHIHALAFKQGFKTLISQIYSGDDSHLDTDVQFGVSRALVAHYQRHDGQNPDYADMPAPWFSLRMTLTVEDGEARLPLPPIK